MAKKETSTKSFVLRVDAATMDAIEKWAADEFRSTNGQLQWIIAEALRKSGRMLNLGPYSTKEFPNIRVYPTIIDRILEGVAVLLAIAAWVCAIWVYIHIEDKITANFSFMAAGLGTLCLLLVGISAYLPIRWIRFPVRITERNVAVQYFMAARIARILNVFLTLLFLTLVFNKVEMGYGIPQDLCNMITSAVVGLMILALIVYYILAFKYK